MTKFILRNRRQLREACKILKAASISTQKKEALVKAIKQRYNTPNSGPDELSEGFLQTRWFDST
jgi:hypothetical protein